MGLDQRLVATASNGQQVQLAIWRKNYELHDWLKAIAFERELIKTEPDTGFSIEVRKLELEALSMGFNYLGDALAFPIQLNERALAAIEAGFTLEYCSDW